MKTSLFNHYYQKLAAVSAQEFLKVAQNIFEMVEFHVINHSGWGYVIPKDDEIRPNMVSIFVKDQHNFSMQIKYYISSEYFTIRPERVPVSNEVSFPIQVPPIQIGKSWDPNLAYQAWKNGMLCHWDLETERTRMLISEFNGKNQVFRALLNVLIDRVFVFPGMIEDSQQREGYADAFDIKKRHDPVYLQSVTYSNVKAEIKGSPLTNQVEVKFSGTMDNVIDFLNHYTIEGELERFAEKTVESRG